MGRSSQSQRASACANAAICAARSTVSGVSQTRISTVPYSGLGRMSQVEILHARHDAEIEHPVVIAIEFRPRPYQRDRPDRERVDDGKPRRVERRVDPLVERTRRRKRDEVGHIPDQRVVQVDRIVRARAPDVDMLSEYGELLREEAVFLRHGQEAFGRVDLAIAPF